MKIQEKVRKYSIIPKRNDGQHFLKDFSLLNREIEHAKIRKDEIVLEVGPGIGNLTELLLQKAKKVIVIEKDKQFKECLEDLQKKYSNLEVIWGDILEVKLPKFDKIVSNLPYKISLPLTFKILKNDFKLGVLIYQEKLAERLSAVPGKERYSRVSVQVQRVADFEFLESIRRDAFYPPPEVRSGVVKIVKVFPKFEVSSENFFKKVLDFMFFKRNKSLKQVIFSLRHFGNQKEVLKEIILELGGMSDKRIFCLTPEEFGKMNEAMFKKRVKIPKIPDKFKRKAQRFS